MICTACSRDCPEGTKFCGHCGSPLAAACHTCGAELQPGFAFCGQCGAKLETSAKPAAPTGLASLGPEHDAERRRVTVMFCDLVGSTELSGQIDPEELREIVQRYHAVAGRAVEQHDGHLAQYLGDGVMVYFGYPRAQEEDARHAVRSALAIIGGM